MTGSFIAVDIGNSRIKFGQFSRPFATPGLPAPSSTLSLPVADWDRGVLRQWLPDNSPRLPLWIASVNRQATSELTEWTKQDRGAAKLDAPMIRLLAHSDLPIAVAVDHPEDVGIDRLAGAVAANVLRDPARPALVVHVGSAITVNLVTADGVFRGGAILPGIGTSARALDAFTDLLPRLPMEQLDEPPPALGQSTAAAIRSGLYWGAVGAMRELIDRLSLTLPVAPDVFLTGGASPSVAEMLRPRAMHVEHLVLAGIALAKTDE